MQQADEGLRPENHRRLNERFYEGKPWVYFERRLMNLALVAGDGDRYRDMMSEPISLGPLKLQEHRRKLEPDEPVGLDEQSFVAAEAQVVLHHVAETLLRLCDAHAPRPSGEAPPSPWLELSRRRSPGAFKSWVEMTIVDAPRDGIEDLVRFVFGDAITGEEREQHLRAYLRLLAEHFLDAESYNAAKHGFALQGARSRLTTTIEDEEVIDDDGLTIEWLGIMGDTPRWTRTTRWFSIEATVAASFMAAWMIRALWLAARHRYLGDPVGEAFAASAPRAMLAAVGVVHPILVEVDEPLAYQGVEPKLHIRKRVGRPLPEEPQP